MSEKIRMLGEEEETGITQKPSEELCASEKSLRDKLRARNWTGEEIDSHYPSANEADVFYMFSAQAFIMGLFNKYSLSLRYGSAEITRAILTEKVMDSLNQHVADVHDVNINILFRHVHDVNAKSLHHNKDSDWAYKWSFLSFNRQIRHYLKQFSEEDTVRPNLRSLPTTFNFVTRIKHRFLEKEVTDVMRSIANMYEFDYK